MKKYSSIEEIREYFENPAIDQSGLKKLLLGPQAFTDDREQKLYFEEKESFIIGSLVDCALTNLPEDFEKQYYCSKLNTKPSDTIMSIINQVYDISVAESTDLEVWKKKELDEYQELILECIKQHNYYDNLKDNVRVAKVLPFSLYFEDLKKGFGKKVVSIDETIKAEYIVSSLKTTSTIKKVLESFNTFNVYFQYPIYFEYKGEKSKALLDILIEDPLNKNYLVVDIKTTAGRTTDFFQAVMKYRYDIQMAFYKEAVLQHFKPNSVNCKFVVESTVTTGNPVEFNLSEDLILQGKEGRKSVLFDGVKIREKLKGYSQLMEEYKYYVDKGFEMSKLLKENSSILTLTPNGIYEEV